MRTFFSTVVLIVVSSSFVSGGLDPDYLLRRGDANSSSFVDATDGMFIIQWLFNGGDAPPCVNQADVDHDGAVTVTDSSYLFNWLFLGGPQPPAPGPFATSCSTTSPYLSCAESPCS